jgi:hypothetical protein
VNGLRVPEVLSSLLYICQVGYLFGLFLCGCSSGSLCFHHASLRAPVFAHPYRCTTFHFPLSAITLLLEVYTCTRTARLLQEVRRDATQHWLINAGQAMQASVRVTCYQYKRWREAGCKHHKRPWASCCHSAPQPVRPLAAVSGVCLKQRPTSLWYARHLGCRQPRCSHSAPRSRRGAQQPRRARAGPRRARPRPSWRQPRARPPRPAARPASGPEAQPRPCAALTATCPCSTRGSSGSVAPTLTCPRCSPAAPSESAISVSEPGPTSDDA